MEGFDHKRLKRSTETKYVTIYIQDDIAQCSFKAIEELDLNITRIIVKDRIDFFEGIAYPCLFDITRVKHSTKEARDFLATEGNELVLASAMLVNSPVVKMMANFYIMVNKPKNPTRMFTDKNSALEWLSQFKQKS